MIPSLVPVVNALSQATSQFFASNVQESGEIFYKAVLPKGATKLNEAKDGSGFIGSAFGEKGLGQARFQPVKVNGGVKAADGAKTAAKINPYMIAIMALLMCVTAKLDEINETQNNVLAFLKQKEKAKLEGSLCFLTDILNNYKFNWNNEKYISSNHIKVLDIKQEAEQSIKLFKRQTETSINERHLFHTTSKVNKSVNNLLSCFEDYRLSVYLYSFSSYVEVLLLENFSREYLETIIRKISDYSLEYRETYTKTYAQLERYTKKTVRSIVTRGASGVTKFLGDSVERIPKLGDTQIDENLKSASDKLKSFDLKTNDQISKNIVVNQKVDVQPFVECLKTIDYLYNEPMTILLSSDTLYIQSKV